MLSDSNPCGPAQAVLPLANLCNTLVHKLPRGRNELTLILRRVPSLEAVLL